MESTSPIHFFFNIITCCIPNRKKEVAYSSYRNRSTCRYISHTTWNSLHRALAWFNGCQLILIKVWLMIGLSGAVVLMVKVAAYICHQRLDCGCKLTDISRIAVIAGKLSYQSRTASFGILVLGFLLFDFTRLDENTSYFDANNLWTDSFRTSWSLTLPRR